VVERFVLDGQSVRLTQAALETLAVIAYQQPVTRSRISAIRGVNCDGVIRTLVTRGLIEECGTQPESGAFLYRTTSVFLEKLGLPALFDRHLPQLRGRQRDVPTSTVLCVLLSNLLLARKPLFSLLQKSRHARHRCAIRKRRQKRLFLCRQKEHPHHDGKVLSQEI
jgi:hypothetical protein